MEIIEDEGLFFNALARKSHVDKSIAGAGIATNGAVAAGSVKTALGGAYVTKIVGGVTMPGWLPLVGGKVVLGKTVTEFSLAAFLAGLNPILLASLGISGVILLFVALYKRQPLTDKDFVSIGDDMGKIVANMIFLPIIIEKTTITNKEVLYRNLAETMVNDFGYSSQFADEYLELRKNQSIQEMESEIKSLYDELKQNKAMKQIYRKFDVKKIRKYALKRMSC